MLVVIMITAYFLIFGTFSLQFFLEISKTALDNPVFGMEWTDLLTNGKKFHFGFNALQCKEKLLKISFHMHFK